MGASCYGCHVENRTVHTGIVANTERDLIFGEPNDWMPGDPYVVQEYGCLE